MASPVGHFDQFIVKFRAGSAEARDARMLDNRISAMVTRAGLVQASAQGSTPALSARSLRRLAVGADVINVGRKLSTAETAALLRAMRSDPSVEYAEIDRMLQPTFVPNDPAWPSMWGLNGSAGIRAATAWDVSSTNGLNEVVAVIDTGRTSHSDLNSNLVAGYDFISNAANARDGNGRDGISIDQGDWNTVAADCQVRNSSWHGTHVSGTVAARTHNALGVSGIAFRGKVQPVRVLGRCGGTFSDISDAVIWASGGTVAGVPANATPAKVLNLSLGGGGACPAVMQAAINSARSRGATVVIAAGNDASDVVNFTPANCVGVVAVGAIGSTGARASFSNFGALVDLAAPGVGIASTLNTGTTVPAAESYANYNGTSMATPHVAGVVAMMRSASPVSRTPSEIEEMLKLSARPFIASCVGCGAGMLTADDAVSLAKNGMPIAVANNTLLTGLSGAAGSVRRYRIYAPLHARNLTVRLSGGIGNPDEYVRFNKLPSPTAFHCRPALPAGSTETCLFATPAQGYWYVDVRGNTAYSGASLLFRYEPAFFSNATDFLINDLSAAISTIPVARSGSAPATLKVNVVIRHTFVGDLIVRLQAPDGTTYMLHNRELGGQDDLIKTYTVDASSELANGTWRLVVTDNAAQDTGKIDSWSLQF
ncbi:S8 family serine peptidase [Montanilutibacter psychrotolerans]|uniref:S8 family serine peptidase n=1 Tax=Montanilutibacter psychrotolerans TaxID=1327343 RepID=UPI001CC21E50|nr:S8 family serine peptidase [Lysobacter psychrotolerans]